MFMYIVKATRQSDPEVYATRPDPKIYSHSKFRIPTSNYIQICSGLTLLELKPEVKVTVTWKQLVSRQGPRCIYIPNMELLP